jgi:hypothetical protein
MRRQRSNPFEPGVIPINVFFFFYGSGRDFRILMDHGPSTITIVEGLAGRGWRLSRNLQKLGKSDGLWILTQLRLPPSCPETATRYLFFLLKIDARSVAYCRSPGQIRRFGERTRTAAKQMHNFLHPQGLLSSQSEFVCSPPSVTVSRTHSLRFLEQFHGDILSTKPPPFQ